MYQIFYGGRDDWSCGYVYNELFASPVLSELQLLPIAQFFFVECVDCSRLQQLSIQQY